MNENKEPNVKTIAIIGGTGQEGKGLAYRWALSGYSVLIGSRKAEKALAAVEVVKELLGDTPAADTIQGMTNPEAVAKCDLAVLTVPFSAHIPILESLKDLLQGKILIDVTVPLVPPKVSKVQMPPAGSATLEAQNVLGENVRVVAAFQNISYENLLGSDEMDCDVLVCGGKKADRAQVIELVEAAGLVGWDAGVAENAVVVEGLTSILIGLNKKYGVHGAGLRITGIPRS